MWIGVHNLRANWEDMVRRTKKSNPKNSNSYFFDTLTPHFETRNFKSISKNLAIYKS